MKHGEVAKEPSGMPLPPLPLMVPRCRVDHMLSSCCLFSATALCAITSHLLFIAILSIMVLYHHRHEQNQIMPGKCLGCHKNQIYTSIAPHPSDSLLVLKRKLSSVSTLVMGNYISAMLKSLFSPKLTRERNDGREGVLLRRSSSSDHHIVQAKFITSTQTHLLQPHLPLLTSPLVGNV